MPVLALNALPVSSQTCTGSTKHGITLDNSWSGVQSERCKINHSKAFWQESSQVFNDGLTLGWFAANFWQFAGPKRWEIPGHVDRPRPVPEVPPQAPGVALGEHVAHKKPSFVMEFSGNLLGQSKRW